MAYDFTNKTAQEITDTLNTIVDNKNSTPADVDAAFDALKTAKPEAQRRAVDDFEDDMIGKTELTAVYPSGDYVPHDDYYGDKGLDTPAAAQALNRIYAIKGSDNAQIGTTTFAEYFADPMAGEDRTSPKNIAKLFDNVIEALEENIGESDTIDTSATLDLIRDLVDHPDFQNHPEQTGAKEAIRRLTAADSYTRNRLIDKLAKIETAQIKTLTDDPQKQQERNMGVFNRFARYIAEAKGDAAPELKAYAAAHPSKLRKPAAGK
jgi:hypothetical protein